MKDLTICVPVFNAVDETVDCVRSLLKSDAKKSQIVILDDGSFIDVSNKIFDEFGGMENITVVTHFRNRGYTRNVNFAVNITTTPYVCILNSDTLVPKKWAVRLIDVLDENSSVAAVGPVSNAASYQSIPMVHDKSEFSTNSNLGFGEAEREKVSQFVARMFFGKLIDVPILNGFCTIFRKSHLLSVGGFDWKSFPQGYGEENDVCFKLRGEGHRLFVCADVFVHHQKSKSFGSEKKKVLSQLGAKVLSDKYGGDFLQSAASVLDENRQLRLVRFLSSLAISKLEKSFDADFHVSDVASLQGPCISQFGECESILERVGPKSNNYLALEFLDNGIVEISVPEGVSLPFIKTDPLKSILYSMAIISYEKPVYIRGAWGGLERSSLHSILSEFELLYYLQT